MGRRSVQGMGIRLRTGMTREPSDRMTYMSKAVPVKPVARDAWAQMPVAGCLVGARRAGAGAGLRAGIVLGTDDGARAGANAPR